MIEVFLVTGTYNYVVEVFSTAGKPMISNIRLVDMDFKTILNVYFQLQVLF